MLPRGLRVETKPAAEKDTCLLERPASDQHRCFRARGLSEGVRNYTRLLPVPLNLIWFAESSSPVSPVRAGSLAEASKACFRPASRRFSARWCSELLGVPRLSTMPDESGPAADSDDEVQLVSV